MSGIAFVPDAALTSYYTGAADCPNTSYDGSVIGVASIHDTATFVDTDWFDIVDAGNGDFVIVQFTVIPDDPDSWDPMDPAGGALDGWLRYAARSSGGHLFSGPAPEPGTFALPALGGLAALRRRACEAC